MANTAVNSSLDFLNDSVAKKDGNFSVSQDVAYSDPEVLALLAMGSVGCILNIAIISISTRRPVFVTVPVKSLVISLGASNLFTIVVCMILNASWHSFGESLFGSDCRFFKTLEAFSFGSTAYVAVIWAIDRCRSVNLGNVEKGGLELPIQKTRHLTKLVITAWVLAILLALQHVIVVSSEDGNAGSNSSTTERLPATMACVSRGRFHPNWKQTVVDLTSICTVFLIPVVFIIGCLAALLVNFIRRFQKKEAIVRPKLPLRRFHSYEDDTVCDDKFIGSFVVLLSVLFVLLWGPYYFVLILKVCGLLNLDSKISSVLYLAGLAYALATPIVYLMVHLCKASNCGKDAYALGRTSSTVRERIEMLQRNQLSRRFDDL